MWQIVSRAITSSEVVDIYAAVGLDKPDASILSDALLDEVRGLPYKNVAFEALARLLNDQIKARRRTNLIQARLFSEELDESIRRYQNKALSAAEIMAELIDLAKEVRDAAKRGEKMGLGDDELAFYDALGVNDSAVQVLGDETLKVIARELVKAVRENVSIDWTAKESVKARLRVIVRCLLARYGYPRTSRRLPSRRYWSRRKDWATSGPRDRSER